jgi:hypothetical protein
LTHKIKETKMNDLITIAKPTRVALLLDESSSMQASQDITLSALEEYIRTLANGGQDIIFSMVTFSNIRTNTLYQSVPIKDVSFAHIAETYSPNGSTPLIDAAMKVIHATEKVTQPGDNIVIAVQTDGQENCSTQFKLADLQAAIKEKSDAGWKFVFLGAGLDAYEQASQLGIRSGSTMSYSTDEKSTRAAFRSMAANTNSYASGGSACMDFSEQQLEDAGDKFYKPTGAPDPSTHWDTKPEPPKSKPMVDDIDL